MDYLLGINMKGDSSELWLQMGKVLWFCQLAEFSLAYFTVANKYPLPTSESEMALALEKQLNSTIGVVVGNLRAAGLLDQAKDQVLSNFVDERNWLAHRIRVENHGDIYSSEKYAALTGHISRLQQSAKVIAEQISLWLEKQAISKGVSPDQIKAEAERLFRLVMQQL